MLLAGESDRLWRKSPRYVPIMCAIAVALGIIPGYFLMTMEFPPQSSGQAWILPVLFGMAAGVVITLPSANIKAMLLNVNQPELRGSVFGIHNITDSVGRGIGPAIGGLLIRGHGYTYAMLFSVYMWIPCAILYGVMAFTISKDLDNLKRRLQEKRSRILESFEAEKEGEG